MRADAAHYVAVYCEDGATRRVHRNAEKGLGLGDEKARGCRVVGAVHPAPCKRAGVACARVQVDGADLTAEWSATKRLPAVFAKFA